MMPTFLLFFYRVLKAYFLAILTVFGFAACSTNTKLSTGSNKICIDGTVQQGSCIIVSRKDFMSSNWAKKLVNENYKTAFQALFGTDAYGAGGVSAANTQFYKRIAPITLNANLDIPFAKANNLATNKTATYIDKINALSYDSYKAFYLKNTSTFNSTFDKTKTDIVILNGGYSTSDLSSLSGFISTPSDSYKLSSLDFTSDSYLKKLTGITQTTSANKLFIPNIINGSPSSTQLGLAFNSSIKIANKDISTNINAFAIFANSDAAQNKKIANYYSPYVVNDINDLKKGTVFSLTMKDYFDNLKTIILTKSQPTILFSPDFNGPTALNSGLGSQSNTATNKYYDTVTFMKNDTSATDTSAKWYSALASKSLLQPQLNLIYSNRNGGTPTDATDLTIKTMIDTIMPAKVGGLRDVNKITVAETAMINKELITNVAKNIYDIYSDNSTNNVSTIISTGKTDNLSTNFNVTYGQTGYYFYNQDFGSSYKSVSVKNNSSLYLTPSSFVDAQLTGVPISGSGIATVDFLRAIYDNLTTAADQANFVKYLTDTPFVFSQSIDTVLTASPHLDNKLTIKTIPNATNSNNDSTGNRGYVYIKYNFANANYASSYAQFGVNKNSTIGGTNYDSKLAGMILEYAKLQGGINSDHYKNISRNLLVAATATIDSDISSTSIPSITNGTRACGAYRDMCITVPYNSNIMSANADVNLASSAVLTSVVDSAKKFLIFTNLGTQYAYLNDFVKTKLTDKINFDDALDGGLAKTYVSEVRNVNTDGSYTIKGGIYEIKESNFDNVSIKLKNFINNMGYANILGYYKGVVTDYANNGDSTGAEKFGGQAGETSINASYVDVVGDKAIFDKIIVTNGKVTEMSITDADLPVILKYLVIDDLVLSYSGKTYINGQEVKSTAIIDNQKIFFNTPCTGTVCEVYAKDPSKTIQSNIFGNGILNSSPLSSDSVNKSQNININNAVFSLNNTTLQGSSVLGNTIETSAIAAIASDVNYTARLFNSSYNYRASISNTTIKPLITNSYDLSNLNSLMFFNQSQFNATQIKSKNYNLQGLNFAINSSQVNFDKNNPLTNFALLQSSGSASKLAKLNGGSFGLNFNKISFRGFYNNQVSLAAGGTLGDEVQNASLLSSGGMSYSVQANNYQGILGFGQKGILVGYNLKNDAKVEFSFARSSHLGSSYYDGTTLKTNSLASIGFSKKYKNLSLGFNLGTLNERGGFLGALTSGAFAVDAQTSFTSLLAKYNLGNLFAFYSGSQGFTNINDRGGILRSSGVIYSSSHILGLGKNNLLTKGDTLAFSSLMPLAIDRGHIGAASDINYARVNLAKGFGSRWISNEVSYYLSKDMGREASVALGVNFARASNYQNIAGLKSQSAMLSMQAAW
jgi:hypothetical protein